SWVAWWTSGSAGFLARICKWPCWTYSFTLGVLVGLFTETSRALMPDLLGGLGQPERQRFAASVPGTAGREHPRSWRPPAPILAAPAAPRRNRRNRLHSGAVSEISITPDPWGGAI